MSSYPLECSCWHRNDALQPRFIQQALRLLPRRHDRSLEVSDRGLIVSGETEASVAAAIETLESVYGADLGVGALTVRHRHGIVVEEPHMQVRVLCPAVDFDAVLEDLLARDAVIADAEVMPPIGVIRATASLARLLGYSQHLAALTDAKAREVIWLSHYAPLANSPAVAASARGTRLPVTPQRSRSPARRWRARPDA